MSTWRDRCRDTIAGVIARVGAADGKALRKALREAYPFGVYDYHPRKMWLSEIRRQLGLERDKRRRAGEKNPVKPDANQKELFE